MKRSDTRAVLAIAGTLALALVAPKATAADNPPTETVDQLAAKAYDLQSAGKYAEAIAVYLRAYDISRDALTLLNIGTIYDHKLHELQAASEFYRRYVVAPDAEPARVQKVTERLTQIKREQEEAERARIEAAAKAAAQPAPPPVQAAPPASIYLGASPPPEQPSSGGGMRAAGVVVGILGLAGLGASFGLGAEARSKNDQANAVCNGSVCQDQNGVSLAKDAGTFATASTASFVGGLVFLTGGIVLFVAAPKGSSAPKTGGVFLSPSVDRTGAGMALHGAF
jgi:hypothetical protein